jgi:tight adherence protein B
MTVLLIIVLVLAVWLAFPLPRAAGHRTRRALHAAGTRGPAAYGPPGTRQGRAAGGMARWRGGGSADAGSVPMTVLVQQLAALLKGGRIPARLWDELWTLYGGDAARDWPAAHAAVHRAGQSRTANGAGTALGPESRRILAAARAAALRGSSVAAAIRREVSAVSASEGTVAAVTRGTVGIPGRRDVRVWGELAACFDTAEASGCPLADVLARFAAHLETEDDAEAARQTALAGPRATVRLLTWLPLSGLGLGLLLGVDPVATLLGNPWGLAALAAGVALTAVGRWWSPRLVRAAAEAPT